MTILRMPKIMLMVLFITCIHLTTVKMQESGFVARVVDFIEKNFVRAFLTDCTNIKNLLKLNHDHISNKTINRLSSVSLTLFSESRLINFTLDDAPVAILSSSQYDIEIPLTIVIHGHDNDPFSPEINPLIVTLKDQKISNILALNYKKLMLDNYYAASTHVRVVGETIGEILAELYLRNVKNIHLIGHSLGAHVSGFAGKVFKKLTGFQIDRITGLDPAGPCFFKESNENRLSKTDAKFVDVIHTDIDTSGFPRQLGHVDFYPNGGDNMPGCLLGTCSHVLSIDYYRSSVIYPKIFLAVKCSDWDNFKKGNCDNNSMITMGHWLNENVENGKYYLNTSSKFPYGMGKSGVKIIH